MDYLLTFIEGFASFISPCMLPMVPIYISYFAGEGEKKKFKTLANSIAFVAGFTIIFIALAILASSLGNALATTIRYAKIIFGIIIIMLGINYMEIINIKFLNKNIATNQKIKDMNILKSFLFGMIFSISWTPCVGSFLGAALLLIAKEQEIYKGIMLILVYSLGLGLPFIISAMLIDILKTSFEFIKKHYDIIKKLSGTILVLMGIYVLFF